MMLHEKSSNFFGDKVTGSANTTVVCKVKTLSLNSHPCPCVPRSNDESGSMYGLQNFYQ